MIPSIKFTSSKKLVGLSLTMSYAENKTGELWQTFMPRRKEIANAVSNNLCSLQVYGENFFSQFNPSIEFTKWALVEVADFSEVPAGMKTFELPEGQYAVFHYKGSSVKGPEVMRYILQEWLPQSCYQLDNRPHFEILGEKYKNNNDESEEEIWIPIQ